MSEDYDVLTDGGQDTVTTEILDGVKQDLDGGRGSLSRYAAEKGMSPGQAVDDYRHLKETYDEWGRESAKRILEEEIK